MESASLRLSRGKASERKRVHDVGVIRTCAARVDCAMACTRCQAAPRHMAAIILVTSLWPPYSLSSQFRTVKC